MRIWQAKHDLASGAGRWARRPEPLAFTLAAVVLICLSSDARAGCGDYVTIGGGHQDQTVSPHSMPPASRGGSQCSGPHCQRQLPLPLSPEQLAPSDLRELASPTAKEQLPRPDKGSLLAEPAVIFSQAVIVPPDRPPRTVC